jgi:hypothetical protein
MKKNIFLLLMPLFYACSNSVEPERYQVFALPFNESSYSPSGWDGKSTSGTEKSGVNVVIIDMEIGKVKSFERFNN